jgi:glycerol-3-phosphate O-acyltransferase
MEYLKFVWRVFSKESNVCLTFGHPMDVFGNKVNPVGESIDLLGKKVDLSLYYQREGQFGFDPQRESIYTKELSEKIVQQYRQYNYVLPSHIVAFCAFTLYSKLYHDYDVYGLVQNPEDEVFLDSEKFMRLFGQIISTIKRKIGEGTLIDIPELSAPLDELFSTGMKSLGAFHDKKVLTLDRSGNIVSEDFIALLYYSNKLNNLGLERSIEWDKVI